MIYLVGGENLYKSLQRKKAIVDAFLEKHPEASVESFDAQEEGTVGKLLQEADSMSLFSARKFLVIKRLFKAKKPAIEQVMTYLTQHPDADMVLWEEGSIDKRLGLYRLLKKIGIVEEFAKPSYIELKSWISAYLKGKVEFDLECIETIIVKTGDDQLQLSLLLDNLILLVKSREDKRLSIKDVELFVAKTVEESIWELVDAIGKRNKKKAFEIMEELLQDKKDFVMMVGMIARQFRILTQVSFLLDRNQSYPDIISQLRLHPFVARKAIEQAKNFSFVQLQKLYEKLLKTDIAVKEGRFEEKLALNLLIAAL